MAGTVHVRKGACLVLAAMLSGCTDAATRVAFEIKREIAAFKRSPATSHSIRHVPKEWPAGCTGPYTVQLMANSFLLVSCKDAASSQVVGGYNTTFHLRFVKVPQTFKLEKGAGEPLFIDVAKQNGRVVVVGLH